MDATISYGTYFGTVSSISVFDGVRRVCNAIKRKIGGLYKTNCIYESAKELIPVIESTDNFVKPTINENDAGLKKISDQRCISMLKDSYLKAVRTHKPEFAAFYVAKCYKYLLLFVANQKGYYYNEDVYLPFLATKLYGTLSTMEMNMLFKFEYWTKHLTSGVKESTIKYEMKRLSEIIKIIGGER